jgi:ATP-binding cassette subfamily B protein
MKSDQRNFSGGARDLLAHLSFWPRTFRLIWAAAPAWTFIWAALLLVQGLLPIALVYLSKLSVDSLVAAANSSGEWEKVQSALILISITAGVMLLSEIMQSVTEWVRTGQSELIQDHIKRLIHQQSMKVDLSFYESPEYFDRLEQARSEAGARPLGLLESCGSLAQNGLTMIGMAGVLASYGYWLPVVLLLGTLPAFYVLVRFDRRYHRWWQKSTSDRRWAQYYDMMLTHSVSAAEMRLFGLGAVFQEAYQRLRKRMLGERMSLLRRQSLARLLAGVIAILSAGSTMLWMVWRAMHGLATFGDLTLFYQAFSRGQGLMSSLLASVGKIYANGLFLGNLFAFLDLQPQLSNPSNPARSPASLKEGIDFCGVTFRYPGSERTALEDFTLSLPAGKVAAIVGPNGAGKTTLVKLLCRFYDPQTGSVKVDGRDLRDLRVEDVWRMNTVLFQFPLPYHATAAENISFGDLQSSPEREEVESAARSAGAHEIISRLPQGYETMLGKWFADGAELSGGEWQRVAMARAYLRQSPIIILDEPTSFMDSWAEAEWFNRFRTLAQGKTALIITHRFTIAMRADIIHVMEQGRIVESGTHHQLLQQAGLYAQSWASQMQAGFKEPEEVSDMPFYQEAEMIES